jgi:hypothetical protein
MNDTTPNGRDALAAFLRTDDTDAGCERTMELLHVYVECVLDGRDPETEHPGIAAHLRTCSPCLEDFDGLAAALRAGLDAGT